MAGLSDEEWEAARALLKNLAHDLNNLISPLYLYGEVLEESLTDPAQKQRASAIVKRSESMKEMVESARWVYKGHEDADQRQAEVFSRRLAALTRSFFQEKHLQVYWVVPKKAVTLPPAVLSGRFLIASQLRHLAFEAAPASAVLIFFAWPEMPAIARAFSGAEAAAAASRFQLLESTVTALDDDAIQSLLASLAKCKAHDLRV